MENHFKCWKIADNTDTAEQKILRIAGAAYTLQPATGEEVEMGTRRLPKWYVERKYKTQVSGPDGVYYDMKSEIQALSFEELIFHHGECIGVYHDELIFLFEKSSTYYQQKYLGEMPTGPDQAICFYDYYYLRFQ